MTVGFLQSVTLRNWRSIVESSTAEFGFAACSSLPLGTDVLDDVVGDSTTDVAHLPSLPYRPYSIAL